MQTLPLRSNMRRDIEFDIPFSVYTVGTDIQNPITRLSGFSAKQILFTFSGSGRFRRLGQDKWDILDPGSCLYIPEGLPHEYVSLKGETWHVGYVTFVERREGMLASWGFGASPTYSRLADIATIFPLIERIWASSGTHEDPWLTTEVLFSLFLEIKRQNQLFQVGDTPMFHSRLNRYRESAVESAVRFLHDHLNRSITMTQLAAHVGYSQKQLTRLFRGELGQTPLQYLQHIRMQTALTLLNEHTDITIRQAAAYVGMEPTYFTRLHSRMYGYVPSQR